jgi:phosphomevalonate kinase
MCVHFSVGVKIQLFEVCAYRSSFCLWGWMKSEVYKENVNTRDELVSRIMNSAALIKQEHQDDLRRNIRTIAKSVEKCIEVDGGIF